MQVSGIGENAAVLLNLVPAGPTLRPAQRLRRAHPQLRGALRCLLHGPAGWSAPGTAVSGVSGRQGKGAFLQMPVPRQRRYDLPQHPAGGGERPAVRAPQAWCWATITPAAWRCPRRRTGLPLCRCGTLWPPWTSACWTTSSWPTVISSPWRPAAFCTADPLKENSPSAPLHPERGAAMFSLHKIRTFVSKFIFTYGIFVVK